MLQRHTNPPTSRKLSSLATVERVLVQAASVEHTVTTATPEQPASRRRLLQKY
jgi:transcription termination factor NusB